MTGYRNEFDMGAQTVFGALIWLFFASHQVFSQDIILITLNYSHNILLLAYFGILPADFTPPSNLRHQIRIR